ncbi:hypothetical protein RHSIM_Rhsim08G0177300 [Rhododendron simsii]|uniref:Uncharacterized protein n=1 Tax=Rhododendron simsii TaxID=118357 RepID=A0A834LGH0_RHOSS|nr:hypothetical protein RHSIM_Rhsim08G0177300 [Rhododendron simsii]
MIKASSRVEKKEAKLNEALIQSEKVVIVWLGLNLGLKEMLLIRSESQIQLFTLQMELAAAEALEAKSKLTSARNDVLDLDRGEADNLGELGQKLKEHRVIAVNNLKEIEALESICFDKKVKVCGKGEKAKKTWLWRPTIGV